jgi:hypothetical protein
MNPLEPDRSFAGAAQIIEDSRIVGWIAAVGSRLTEAAGSSRTKRTLARPRDLYAALPSASRDRVLALATIVALTTHAAIVRLLPTVQRPSVVATTAALLGAVLAIAFAIRSSSVARSHQRRIRDEGVHRPHQES